MKKFILTIAIFAFITNVSAQLKVDSIGNTHILGNICLENNSNAIAAANDVSIKFNVNGLLAGNTGSGSDSNVSFGYGAFSSKGTGNYNTAIGKSAFPYTYEGSYNTATGYSALPYNSTGNYNTANGADALHYTTGSYNTGVGVYALQSNYGGNYNTAIGYNASSGYNDKNNATALGRGAYASSDNQARIGNTSVTSIGGYVNWTNFSDERANKNIRTNVPGLAFINGLQPITYNLDLDAVDDLLKIDKTQGEEELSPELIEINKKAREAKEKVIQTGFIAQDVEKIAQSIGYDFSGVDVDDTGIYGLRYAEFVVPLVKAVQELSAQNERLQALVDSLLEKNAESTPLKSESAGESTTGLQSPASSIAYLQQNAPNPFSQSTQIKYYLPATVKTAYLCIYDLQGAQLKQTVIQERGEGVQILYGSELKAGMYLYTLIADGQEVDTKRMILTK